MNELFLLRLAVGVIFIYHAIPKLQNPKAMATGTGWRLGQVLGLGIIEFMSGLSLIGGITIKLSALLLSVVMVGAIYHKINKWKVPFSAPNSTGWEFDLILLAANLTLYFNY
ncbi:MAG: DoxX family protein [bacterium]|nr:DoxX family protein [bacterium]